MAALTSLRSAQDFRKVRNQGRQLYNGRWLVIYALENDLGRLRLGCTLPRYVGNAVTRNRLRRWTRENLRQWSRGAGRAVSMDLSLIFRRQSGDFFQRLSHREFDETLAKGLERI